MKTNLFVITSPLQYLNALEARRHYQIDSASAVLVVIGQREGEESLRQVQRLLVGSVWGRIALPQGLPPKGLLKRPRFAREFQYYLGALKFRRQVDALLEETAEVERIFLGDWRARSFRYFLSRRPEAKAFLLDDGSVTSQAFRFRNDPRDPQIESKAFPDRNPKPLRLAGVPFYDPDQITFFTSYDLPSARRDNVERHSFESLKVQSDSWQRADEAWFIGSNHAENGIASEASYLSTMAYVRSFFQKKDVRYFAHRGEAQEKLQKLEAMGFVVTHSELPLEVVIREQKTYPRILGAIASSVVDNLAAILGARIAVFLFLAPGGYYRQRAKHLADIVHYHLEASGGNLFAVPVDQREPLSTTSANPAAQLESYEHFIRTYLSVSAYGAHSTHPTGTSLRASFSGVTFRPTDIKNTLFKAFLRDAPLEFEAPVEATWPGTRTVPIFRSAPCPVEHGRRHWLLFEGPSENLLSGDILAAQVQGCSLRQVLIAHGIVSPAGPSGAVQISENHGAGSHRLSFLSSELDAGGDYAFSLYVKRAGRERVALRAVSASHETWAAFNLASGRVVLQSEGSGASPTITATSEQWYRIALPFRATPGSVSLVLELLDRDPSAAPSGYEGDGLSGVYLYGVQLSVGTSTPVFLPSRDAPRARPGDAFSLTFSAQPFQGPFLLLLRVHHDDPEGCPAPLLTIKNGDAECFRLRGGPNGLELFAPGSPAHEFRLAATSSTQQLVLQLSQGSKKVLVGVNGLAQSLEFDAALELVDGTTWTIGEPEGSYYRFLIEELRVARAQANELDVAALSTLPNLA
jgi:hypothetical protein